MNLESRHLVWIEMSELFLDTDLSDNDLERIGATFINSGLTYSEIKKIELYEVLPSLWRNQATLGFGVWLGFDEDWVIENCSKNYLKRNEFTHKLKCRFLNISNWVFRYDYWKKLKKQLRKPFANSVDGHS